MINELDWGTIKPPKLKKDKEEKPDWESIEAPIYQYKPSSSELDKKALNKQFQTEQDWESLSVNPNIEPNGSDWEKVNLNSKNQPITPEEGFELSAYQEPEKSIFNKVKDSILGVFKAKPEVQIAKAQVSYNISQATGKPIDEVEKNLPAYTKALGVRGIPTSEEFLSAMFTFPVTAALISNPVTTGIGVTKFLALTEAENFVISKIKGIGYKFGAGKGLKELAPEDTNQITKDIIDVIDFIAKGYLIGKTDKNITKMWNKFTKEISTKYGLPKKMYLNVDKIKDMHLNAKETTQFEQDIYASMKDKAGIVRKAFKEGGVDIEIPATEMITFADKPWYAKVKQAFGVKPFSKTIINKAGEVKLPTLAIEGNIKPKLPTIKPTEKPSYQAQPAIGEGKGIDATPAIPAELEGLAERARKAGNISDFARALTPEQQQMFYTKNDSYIPPEDLTTREQSGKKSIQDILVNKKTGEDISPIPTQAAKEDYLKNGYSRPYVWDYKKLEDFYNKATADKVVEKVIPKEPMVRIFARQNKKEGGKGVDLFLPKSIADKIPEAMEWTSKIEGLPKEITDKYSMLSNTGEVQEDKPTQATAKPAPSTEQKAVVEPVAGEGEVNKIQEWIDEGNSKPVAESLAKIEEAGLLDNVEGHSGKGGILPFSVRVKDKVTGKIKYITKATELHKFAEDIDITQPTTATGETSSPLTPIEGTGETKTRGLAKSVASDIEASYGDLPQYKTLTNQEQVQKAVDIVSSDYELAKKIALGEENPPKGLLPEFVFTAIRNKARKEGDVNTQMELATNVRKTAEATVMGQKIQALGVKDPLDPVFAIQDINKKLEESAKKRYPGKVYENTKTATINKFKETVKAESTKANTKYSWEVFIKSITCT